MKRLIIITLICLISLFTTPVLAADLTHGEQLFSVNCAGCHPNGSNIIRRGKNLKQNALKKNKVDNLEAVTNLIANGKGIMSAYKDRLTPEEISNVATYVLEQAAKDWPKK